MTWVSAIEGMISLGQSTSTTTIALLGFIGGGLIQGDVVIINHDFIERDKPRVWLSDTAAGLAWKKVVAALPGFCK